MTAPTHPRATITVPASLDMVTLLGPADELLRVVESAFPEVDVHVRGNEITVTGAEAEADHDRVADLLPRKWNRRPVRPSAAPGIPFDQCACL
mgnify:CR=1 FL=1